MSERNGHFPHTYDHQPGDGWKYTVLVSELPHAGFMGGGLPEDYVVVTVWLPGDTAGRAYVLRRFGTLTDRYVQEKFCRGVANRETAQHVGDAIRHALGRPGRRGDEGDPD